MQSASQKASLLGQPSKAVSFTHQTRPNWTDAVALVPPVPDGSASQSLGTTAVAQEADQKEDSPVRERIFVAPPLSWSLSPSLNAKQLWEGTVLSCSHHGFTARLKDRTNPANPDEITDFDFEEIRRDDVELVAPGAAFYWTLGTEQSDGGQVTNVMRVNFRRIPTWNKASLANATKAVSDVLSLFGQQEEGVVVSLATLAEDGPVVTNHAEETGEETPFYEP